MEAGLKADLFARGVHQYMEVMLAHNQTRHAVL